MKRWMLLLMLVPLPALAQADLYRWVDADGKVHYSDQLPPPDARQVERMKALANKPGDPQMPYALQQAVKNFPVTLYVSECGESCDRARQLLAKRGIPYTEMEATDKATQEELKKLIGANLVVPVLTVGREVLKGLEEGQWNTTLDAAGYPQTAVIPPRPPTRPVKPAPPAAAAPEASAPPPEEPAPGSDTPPEQ